MNQLTSEEKANFKILLNDDWKERAAVERRSDKDNRINRNPQYFKKGGQERRKIIERRNMEERRDGWMRVGRWQSESVFDE
jgi:hypothetical protein